MNSVPINKFFSNKLILSFAAFFFASLVAISIFFLMHPTSSSNLNFSKFAYFFAHGEGRKLFSIDDRCVITPFLASSLVRFGFAPYAAVYIIGSIFFTFTIIPLYFILKNFFNSTVSCIGCIMYSITPMIVSGFKEIQVFERNFFILAAVALLFALKDKKSYLKLIIFGVCLGALVIVRPKSIIFVVFFLFIYFLINYKNKKTKLILNYIVIFMALSITIAPAVYQVYEFTGYPGLTLKQAAISKRIFHFLGEKKKENVVNRKVLAQKKEHPNVDKKAIQNQPEQIAKKKNGSRLKKSNGGIKYIDISPPKKSFFDSYFAVFIRNLLDFNIVYKILLFWGIVLAFKRRLFSSKLYILIFLVLLNIFICYKYSLERVQYASLNVILFFPFIMHGMKEHLPWLKEFTFSKAAKFILGTTTIVLMYIFSLIAVAF